MSPSIQKDPGASPGCTLAVTNTSGLSILKGLSLNPKIPSTSVSL